jgi:hypothetical protein
MLPRRVLMERIVIILAVHPRHLESVHKPLVLFRWVVSLQEGLQVVLLTSVVHPVEVSQVSTQHVLILPLHKKLLKVFELRVLIVLKQLILKIQAHPFLLHFVISHLLKLLKLVEFMELLRRQIVQVKFIEVQAHGLRHLVEIVLVCTHLVQDHLVILSLGLFLVDLYFPLAQHLTKHSIGDLLMVE